jgi:hypothetical protein
LGTGRQQVPVSEPVLRQNAKALWTRHFRGGY